MGIPGTRRAGLPAHRCARTCGPARSGRRWCRADQWHADPAKLRALLADPQLLSEDDLIRAADLVAAASGKQWAEAAAQLAAANASLAAIDLPAGVRAELTANVASEPVIPAPELSS